jgi:phage-related minor tail protein
MSDRELNVSLRFQALTDQARQSVKQLKADLNGLNTGRTGGSPATVQQDAQAQSRLTTATSGAAAAAREQAAAVTQASAAQAQQASAAAQAVTAVNAYGVSLQGAAAAARALPAQVLAQTAAVNQSAAASAKAATAYAGHTGAFSALTAASQASAKQAQAQEAAARKGGAELNKYGVSAKQTAAAMRMLPAQITDITTSVASGMPIWLTAIQQGGQIKDSFGGIRPAASALTGVLTPLRLAIGGVTAAGLGLLAIYRNGEQETRAFNTAIQTTGNYAGATRGRIEELAVEAKRVSGISVGAARDIAVGLVQSGRLGIQTIGELTKSAEGYAAVTGQSVENAAAALGKAFENPSKAARELDGQLNFLTVSQRRYIDDLVEQGRIEEAQLALSQRLSAHLGGVAVDNLGTLERAWRAVAGAIGEAKEALLSIGRPETMEQAIAANQRGIDTLRAQIAARQERGQATGKLPALLAAKESRQATLDVQKAARDQDAAMAASDAQFEQRLKAADDRVKRRADSLKTGAEVLADSKRDLDLLLKAGKLTQDEYDKNLKREQEAARKRSGGGSAYQGARAASQMTAAQLKADLSVLQATIRESDALIEQALKDGTTTIGSAYDQRLANLRQENQAQREAIEQELGAVGKALGSAKNASERSQSGARKVELEAQLKVLDVSLREGERKLAQWKEDQERTLSTISARIRVDLASVTGVVDPEALRRQVEQQLRPDLVAAGQLGGEDGERTRQNVQLLIEAGAAQAEFNARLAEAQRLQAALSVQEESVRVQQQQGQISAIEAEARLIDLRAAQVPALQAILAQLEAIRSALPPEAAATLDNMSTSIGQLRNQTKAATPAIAGLGTTVTNTFIDAIPDAVGNAASQFENLGQVAKSTLKQIAGAILNSGIKSALQDLFRSDTSGGGGSGFFGAIVGGVKSMFGYAEGGHIRGPGTGTSDSIPAVVNGRTPIRVSNDEFIQPQRAVRHYGLGFMEAVRTLKLPKPRPGFALGGLVRAHHQARFATGGSTSNAAAADSGSVNVKFELITRGTPQRVVQQSQQVMGKDVITRVILEDAAVGGPIFRGLQSAQSRG